MATEFVIRRMNRSIVLTVSNLPPVPLQARDFRSGGVEYRFYGDVHGVFTISSQFVEEGRPDLAAVVFGEVAIVEGDVDAGDEGVVKGADTVGCEEEDALAIFHCAEEAW